MNNIEKKIIAIGGGGFTHKSDIKLDEFILSQCKKSKIKFGFLPTASKDSPEKIDLFYIQLGHYVSIFPSVVRPDFFGTYVLPRTLFGYGGYVWY